MHQKPFGNDREVSELTGLPPIVIRRLAKRGELPGVIRLGRHMLFDMAKIRNFLGNGGNVAQQKADGGR